MTTATAFAARAGAGFAHYIAAAALAVANAACRWYRRECDLRHVLQHDEHLLRDIGLTREDVMRNRLRLYGQG